MWPVHENDDFAGHGWRKESQVMKFPNAVLDCLLQCTYSVFRMIIDSSVHTNNRNG